MPSRDSAAPSASPEQASRIDSLDGLRGLMAWAVVVYHLSVWTHAFGRGTRASSLVAVLGIYAVQGFFIISGFCFFLLYRDEAFNGRALWRFHVKRFFRIAPLYYVAVLLSVLFESPSAMVVTPRKLLENLTLSFGFVHPNRSLVLGGWSIGIEYVFYALFPLLAWLTRRTALLYVATGGALLLALPWTFGWVQSAPELARFNSYVQVPNHAFLFLLGGIAAHLFRRGLLHTGALGFALGLGALALLALAPGHVFYDHFEVMAGPSRVYYVALSFLVVLLFASFRAPKPALRRAFASLGEQSYAVYLLHPFAHMASDALIGVQAHALVRFFVIVLFTWGFAALASRYIERPTIAWGKRLAQGRAQAPRGAKPPASAHPR